MIDTLLRAKGEWVLQSEIRRTVEETFATDLETLLAKMKNPKQRLVIVMGQVMAKLREEGYLDERGWAASRAYRMRKRFL